MLTSIPIKMLYLPWRDTKITFVSLIPLPHSSYVYIYFMFWLIKKKFFFHYIEDRYIELFLNSTPDGRGDGGGVGGGYGDGPMGSGRFGGIGGGMGGGGMGGGGGMNNYGGSKYYNFFLEISIIFI